MSLPYTTGNWTIEKLYTDSISTPKTMSLPDFDWANDWNEASKPQNRSVDKSSMEAYYGNVTGPSVEDVEHVTVSFRATQNVYDGLPLPVDSSSQLKQKSGRVAYRQLVTIYKATNSVSGEEVYLPVKGAITITVPASPLISADLVGDFRNRLYSSFLGTGETGVDELLKQLRRDLDPTR